VDGAGTVGAEFAVPAVAVAGDPRIDFGGEPADAGDKKNPAEVTPAGQEQADAGPRFGAAGDAAARVDGLHPAHSEFAIDLGEALQGGGVVEVEELDVVMSVETLDRNDGGTTEAAGAVVEDEEVGGFRRCGHINV